MNAGLRMLVRPSAAAAALRRNPRWVLVFALLCVGYGLLDVIAQHHATSLALTHLPPSVSEAERAHISSGLSEGLLQRSTFLPVRLLTGWSAFAAVLFLLIRSLRSPGPVPFVCVLALEIHAEMILLADRVVTTGYGLLISSSDRPFVSPLSVATFVAAPDSLPIFFLLGSLNFFTLWYVAVVATGIRVLSGLTIRTSALVAVGAWALSELFNSGILTLLIRSLHLQV